MTPPEFKMTAVRSGLWGDVLSNELRPVNLSDFFLDRQRQTTHEKSSVDNARHTAILRYFSLYQRGFPSLTAFDAGHPHH
jgi:hypothetical protein